MTQLTKAEGVMAGGLLGFCFGPFAAIFVVSHIADKADRPVQRLVAASTWMGCVLLGAWAGNSA